MPKQACILVGGRGTRLGSLTTSKPKPLLPVGGRPFLDYLVENVARHQIEEILLLCAYRSDEIMARYDGQTILVLNCGASQKASLEVRRVRCGTRVRRSTIRSLSSTETRCST